MRIERSLAFLPLLVLVACSGSDDAGGTDVGKVPQSFSAYCTGITKVRLDLMKKTGPAAWAGDNTTGSAPAGSVFLVASSFDKWEGFVFDTSGTPLKLHGDFSTGLVKDQDFTSDCAVDAQTGPTDTVLLADSHFYAEESLGGSACKLAQGTELTSFSFMATGSVAQVSSTEIQAECSLSTSYSKDVVYGALVPK